MAETPRLLALLEGELAPTLHGRKAWFRPKPEIPRDIVKACRIPEWNWKYFGPSTTGQDSVTLDANAAWLSAMSTVSLAFGALEHSGPLPAFPGWPGYYRVRVDENYWGDLRIVHPLGRADLQGYVWLAQPTVTLLAELHRRWDAWPQLEIIDSWTCSQSVRPKKWVENVRDTRTALIDAGDREQLAAFKLAYTKAVQCLPGPKDSESGWDCLSRRPDWNHAIRAAHAANMWRKAWNCVQAGFGPVRMGTVDELEFGRDDLMALESLHPTPIKLDQTGRTLGSFKIKRVDEPQDAEV